MMAAYQSQPGMHPGMAHGHPGMAPTPQHMGQPMMHPGASGPGQPHVSQAGAMMGMQPGANGPMGAMPGGQHPGGMGMPGQPGQPGQGMGVGGANMHGLNHMTPQQIQLHQHQLQQMQQQNPMAMAQQQQILRQRMAAQVAQQQASGMMGMPQGAMQGMTPQQMQQYQQQQQQHAGMHPNAASVQLPPHLVQQQMQLRMQQQQAQQNHQAQLQQQQLAMQHANSQQSNQGQPGPPNQQGQPGHPPQMRPQSRMANPNEQSQGPPPQQHPQQGPQGQPQQTTPQPGQQQPTPQQGQQPGMTQQQQIQFQQQRMAMIQQRQQQQQQMQARQIQQAQAQAQAAAQQQQQAQTRHVGDFILRINLFSDHLSNFDLQNGKDLNLWNQFVDKHFAPEGRLMHSFDDNPNGKPKTYEVLRPTIARYFWTYFESGAQSLRLHIEHAREHQGGNGGSQVTCSSATLVVSYPTGARLEMSGRLNVLFSPVADGIECLEIRQTSIEEIITRSEIEKVLSNWPPTMDTKSPKMTKSKLPKAQQKLQQRFEGLTIDSFPKAPKGTMGVTARVQQFLELGETMTVMSELMHFAQEKKMRPEQALEAWVAQYDASGGNGQGAQQPIPQGNPQINLPPNGVPMGSRTPSMQNMHMQQPNQQGNFSSPSVSNMSLPMQNGMNGSPHIPNHPGLAPNMSMQPNSHTPSPHISNMAAPPMMPQHSQQGTNSSGPSANTSPNVNNKRRRSTVKMEGEDGGAQDGPAPNQQRVKPSPRMTKKAKPGG